MIKGSIHQQNINIHVSSIRTPKYMEKILIELNGEIHSSTITGAFNNPLSIRDKISKQKTNKETGHEKHYRPKGPKRHMRNILGEAAQHTFFSSTPRT
jgi:hypothetical protein